MGNFKLAGSALVALLLGVALRFVLIYAWNFEAQHMGLSLWLHARGWQPTSIGYIAIATGFAIETVLSLPFAWGILALRPRHPLIYAMLAVVPPFIYFDAYLHWKLALDWDLALALSYARVLLALPLAVWVLSRLRRFPWPNVVPTGS